MRLGKRPKVFSRSFAKKRNVKITCMYRERHVVGELDWGGLVDI